MDRDIGSLEAGKLADLIVIDGNPLQDIRQSEKVTWTMVNGRLYDAATLNETGARETQAGEVLVGVRRPFYAIGSRTSNSAPPPSRLLAVIPPP